MTPKQKADLKKASTKIRKAVTLLDDVDDLLADAAEDIHGVPGQNGQRKKILSRSVNAEELGEKVYDIYEQTMGALDVPMRDIPARRFLRK